VLNAAYQRRWLDSLQPEDPSKPRGQRYGYGIIQISWGPNTIYFHGGEVPGFNSFMDDPNNRVTLVVWTNLTVSLDEQPTANTLMLKVLDQITWCPRFDKIKFQQRYSCRNAGMLSRRLPSRRHFGGERSTVRKANLNLQKFDDGWKIVASHTSVAGM
jgi:hypothetical protein